MAKVNALKTKIRAATEKNHISATAPKNIYLHFNLHAVPQREGSVMLLELNPYTFISFIIS